MSMRVFFESVVERGLWLFDRLMGLWWDWRAKRNGWTLCANSRDWDKPARAAPSLPASTGAQLLPRSTREMAVVAGLLVDCPTTLTPYVAKLIEHAPSVFDDLRVGQIAAAIRKLVESGKPITPLGVRALLPQGEYDLMLGGVDQVGLPEGTREQEAKWLWQEAVDNRVWRRLNELAQVPPGGNGEYVAEIRRQLGMITELISQRDGADTLLSKYQLDFANPPPEARVIYTLAGVPVCTSGNITSIVAASKVGKSAVIGAMAASVMAVDSESDCLGFESSNEDQKNLLLIDSEQSRAHHYKYVERILTRAGRDKPPGWFKTYMLAGLAPVEAWKVVQAAIDDAKRNGGLHSVLLDGVADLVLDVNDAKESADFVMRLHELAIEHDCCIVCVLHFNPGTEKSRGHLGSCLERKSESNLRLDKDEAGVTTVWSDKQRGASIPKQTGPCFAWSDQAGMHVSIETAAQRAAKAERSELAELVADVFDDKRAMSYTDLRARVEKVAGCSASSAIRKMRAMVQHGLVQKDLAGLWSKVG